MKTAPFYDICAAFYEADYAAAGRGGDVEFYAGLARRAGGPVLEMGCGSGRVLLPCARACAGAGSEITGLDISPAMLEQVRQRLADEPTEVRRRVHLVEGDLCHVEAGAAGTFPLVTAPFRVIQHLVGREEQRAWLANVRRHLAPGGALVFDVFQPDYGHLVGPASTVVDLERTDPATGDGVERHATAWHTPELQTFRVRFEWWRTPNTHEPDRDESVASAETPLATAETEVRWFTLAELTHLLELEGFRVTDAWGNFDGEPFGPGADDIILRAERA